MNQYDEWTGKMVQLTYSDLDGETVQGIGKILYTLKNRAFVFETIEEGRQVIVYNRHVMDIHPTSMIPPILTGDEIIQDDISSR
ncbi:hypothetical protein PP175_22940 [Aneurinibacillus sp. Ricciae_BoGa-3]|uniref:hypothetical protein n=1 Tax=Aneurinibacillus sp. Ricciae_BoGa-3 TaxID=3022697 RepID=UPI0023412BD9|nr:hypothetical protein [Aneurinibacillus sp. Ricciae_BoGa-3]WCK54126.1 hypothetical protein PP175_22940 [Aneurinibacillus sp. Ricciae_BoGa-3]